MHRTRRGFLTDLGRTSLGLVVIGAGLSACGNDDPVVEGPTTSEAPVASDPPTATATTETLAAAEHLLVDLGFVAAYVVMRDGEATIVDTGVPGSEGAIEGVLSGAGLGWADVGNVIVTHNHDDHAGSLAAIADLATGAALHGGAADIPSMTSPRDVAAVGNGDVVFGLEIIETPGHTAGHVSVLDPVGRFVITGDAIVGEGGGLAGPSRQFTANMLTAVESVALLATLDVDEVLVGHGFPVTAGTAELGRLAARL